MQKCFKILLIILIPIIIYLASFGFFAYNDAFYTKLTNEHSNIPEKAESMNQKMVEYFASGNTAFLKEFTRREAEHLKDVKRVINRLMIALMTAAVVFILLIHYAEEKQKIFLYSGFAAMAIPIIFAVIPFDFLFTKMHAIFFAKGSWVFAQNSLLLKLYPIIFFNVFARTVFLTGFCLGLVMTLLSLISCRK